MSGSLWNKNSWHWEERNHTQQATAMLTELFSPPINTGESDFPLKNFRVKGYANSSVRKGRLIVAFEFTASAEIGNSGDVEISEFCQDELQPRVTLPPEISDHKKSVTAEVHSRLEMFARNFRSLLEDETAKAAGQARRTEEGAKAAAAQQTRGDEKIRLLHETKKHEKTSDPSEVKASVWNANAYHWETKNAWTFVKEFLERKFADLDIQPKISGEAEVSVRKGKKIVVFDLNIESEIFEISDLTQDDLDDFKITWKSDKQIPRHKLLEIFSLMNEQMKNL